jgi:glycosyltransferase involved in cell wall biosynthesis
MRILYVSQYYPPEMGAPAARVSELARAWAWLGHKVTVLTGFPNHPTGCVPPEYRRAMRRLTITEQDEGVTVVRTWLAPLPNRKPLERIVNYGSFFASASLRGLFLQQPDVVIGTSPQLLVGLAGWALARAKRCPFVFEVRDLWPESLLASGMGRQDSAFIRALDRLASFLYRSADHIVAVTPAMRDDLLTVRGLPEGKVSVVTNGVDTSLFRPLDQEECRGALGLEQRRFIAAYVGTIGMAHGLDTVLETARRLRERLPQALLILVGEGASREALERQAQAEGLDNVRFCGQQPRERVPQFIGASDVCLVPLRRAEVFKTVIPSKMLEMMACARPVILSVEGQAREILEEARAGRCVLPEDAAALTDAVVDLAWRAGERERLGASGRSYIERHYHRERLAGEYADVLTKVTGIPALAAPASLRGELARDRRAA